MYMTTKMIHLGKNPPPCICVT